MQERKKKKKLYEENWRGVEMEEKEQEKRWRKYNEICALWNYGGTAKICIHYEYLMIT